METKIEKDIRLLNESIEHWKRMQKGGEALRRTKFYSIYVTSFLPETTGSVDCPLCEEYLSFTDTADRCKKCPIFTQTGKSGCKGTPYENAVDAYTMDAFYPTPEFKAAAQKEIDFLTEVRDNLINSNDAKEVV